MKEIIMEYCLADENDLHEITALSQRAIENMQRHHIDQWDSLYPVKEDFEEDIINRQLYIGKTEGRPAVIFTVNQDCDEQYRNGKWAFPDQSYCVIHRLCVDPLYQNRGVGRKTMQYIEKLLRDREIWAIRLDVFSQNPFALKLYEHMGYARVGSADWRKGRFYLMEKYL